MDLTTQQFSRVTSGATKPAYLVQLEHAGFLEYFATIEDAYYDGNSYLADGIDVADIRDQVSASIDLFATPTRIMQSISGSWRNGKRCKIYAIPSFPDSVSDYILSEAFLVFDGVLDSSAWSNSRIRITAIPKTTSSLYTPRNTFSEISAIMPSPGSVVNWEGGTVVLQART